MIHIYEDEIVKFFAENTGCSLEQAYAYCEAEDVYLDDQALISYDPNERPRDNGPYIGAPVIDNEEMVAFIMEETGLEYDLVERLSELEIEYLEMQTEEEY